MSDKRKYTIQVECTNCRQYRSSLDIPEGVTVEDYLERECCPVCGCNTLRRYESDYGIWKTPYYPPNPNILPYNPFNPRTPYIGDVPKSPYEIWC